MADEFSSMEEVEGSFDAGAQPDIQEELVTADEADLARQRAILGDDADLFAASGDAAILTGTDDLLDVGSGDDALSSCDTHVSNFRSEGIQAPSAPSAPSASFHDGHAKSFVAEEEEPQVIREWRERRDAAISKRAAQFAAQREETIKEARQNVDDFYENYNGKKDKLIAQTRKDAENFVAGRDDTVDGTSWERIAKLVDVSGKGVKGGAAGSGKERFREILLSLRKDEKAPGAVTSG